MAKTVLRNGRKNEKKGNKRTLIFVYRETFQGKTF